MKFKLLILSLMLLTLNACGGFDNSTNNTKINKTTAELPVNLQKMALDNNGILNAYIAIDDGERLIMRINPVDASSATASIPDLSLASHTVSIIYEFTTVNGKTYTLANANKTINLSSGTTTLKFLSDDYQFDAFDDDGDGISNASELATGSDPESSLRLYLSANDGVVGQELFVTDGTTGGTFLVKDINTSGNSSPDDFIVINGILYFKADDGFSGVELWRSNGTTEGTIMVKDINEGLNSGISSFSVPPAFNGVTVDETNPLITIGDTFYFIGDDGMNGIGLWKSDGTTEGTLEVSISPGVISSVLSWPLIHGSLTAVGKNLYFLVPNTLIAHDLYKFDEVTGGTAFVGNVDLSSSLSSLEHSPYRMVSVGDMLYFASDGIQLWKSDSTANNRVFIKDIKTGVALEDVLSKAVAVENLLYFVEGAELWKSDGTAVGTVLVSSKLSAISDLIAVGNVLYFSADDGINGAELWKSDGTNEGTVLVRDINVGGISSSPIILTVLDSGLFFAANDGINGVELWKSDGTEEGTVLVKDINTGFTSSSPSLFTVVKDKLYFKANDGVTGNELWKSDGTKKGTVLVKDILTGISGSELTIIGGSNLN